MKQLLYILLGIILGVVGSWFYQVFGKPALPTFSNEYKYI